MNLEILVSGDLGDSKRVSHLPRSPHHFIISYSEWFLLDYNNKDKKDIDNVQESFKESDSQIINLFSFIEDKDWITGDWLSVEKRIETIKINMNLAVAC